MVSPRASQTGPPSASTSILPGKLTHGIRPALKQAVQRVRIRRAIVRAGSASSTSLIFEIPMATSFAASIARRSELGDHFRKQGAWRATGRGEACVGGNVYRHEF